MILTKKAESAEVEAESALHSLVAVTTDTHLVVIVFTSDLLIGESA